MLKMLLIPYAVLTLSYHSSCLPERILLYDRDEIVKEYKITVELYTGLCYEIYSSIDFYVSQNQGMYR